MANHREIGSLLIIVDNRAGGKINEENRESPAEIGRVGMSVPGWFPLDSHFRFYI